MDGCLCVLFNSTSVISGRYMVIMKSCYQGKLVYDWKRLTPQAGLEPDLLDQQIRANLLSCRSSC